MAKQLITSLISSVSDSNKLSFRKTFIRAQLVSICATTVDFLISILLHHLLGMYYVTATTIGAFCGSITSFSLGRNWVFLNRRGRLSIQFLRFVIINGFSIFGNTTGVFFFKENFDISFIASRVIVAILIGIFFNFFMNRYFVFR
ncbi:MAG: GtrA family protein [Saprospiraceae bacterium]|nr:GtrA family protein [Saprospiraceae bacterium]